MEPDEDSKVSPDVVTTSMTCPYAKVVWMHIQSRSRKNLYIGVIANNENHQKKNEVMITKMSQVFELIDCKVEIKSEIFCKNKSLVLTPVCCNI